MWLCLCRWLGNKIPVLWHQPGQFHLFEGGTVHSLSEDMAEVVSSCLTELFMWSGAKAYVCPCSVTISYIPCLHHRPRW